MISVVVPVWNETENLPALRARLTAALNATGEPWEVIAVDDGSTDGTCDYLGRYHAEDARWKAIRLSRNFGHQPSLTAGLHHARGDAVVLIDGDLQDPPEVIPALVAQWRRGYRVVLAERRSRADTGLRGLGCRAFHPLWRYVSDLPHESNAGIFGLMDRQVVDVFNAMPERSRFIPGLRGWLGFETASVPYDRQARAAGEVKQRLRSLVRYAADGMLGFSVRPLRLATYAGLAISAAAFLLAGFYVVTFFALHKPISGFTTIIASSLFLGGVQLLCTGILGEYLGRVYEEVKQRPMYVVRERIGVAAVAAVAADPPPAGRTAPLPQTGRTA